MTATAKVIADSISEAGIRITTLELEFERFLLAQFNTHRMFSRSAQSSRAVPVSKLIENAEKSESPHFMKNEAGMQSTQELSKEKFNIVKDSWNEVKSTAIYFAQEMSNDGCHKQFVNRLLEPFSTVKVVVTATEWQNFFDLRLHHAAQPEMQELAQAMKTAVDESTPKPLVIDEWHLPYIDAITRIKFSANEMDKLALISAARCARVSYLNHDNSTPDIEKDLELANRLLTDKHLSPFEHQAKPMELSSGHMTSWDAWENGVTHIDRNNNVFSGNFVGWVQNRQLLENVNDTN